MNRRDILERDPPYDFVAAITEIRRLRPSWGTSDLCFVLNMARSTLWSVEGPRRARPNVDDGDAIRKLLQVCRDNPEPVTRPHVGELVGVAVRTFDARGRRLSDTRGPVSHA